MIMLQMNYVVTISVKTVCSIVWLPVFEVVHMLAVRVDRTGPALAPRLRALCGLRQCPQRKVLCSRRQSLLQKRFLQVSFVCLFVLFVLCVLNMICCQSNDS